MMDITRLTNALKKLGCENITIDDDFLPIEKVLRSSWYVDKAIELGYKECKYIKLDESFIVILDNGKLMSGGNIMIPNFLESLEDISNVPYDSIIDIVQSTEYYYDDDDSLVIFDIDDLEDIIEDYL